MCGKREMICGLILDNLICKYINDGKTTGWVSGLLARIGVVYRKHWLA